MQWEAFMLTMYFVCHGATDWNLDKRCTGQADIPLSSQGRTEVVGVAQSLKSIPIAKIYTSDLCRATETAEIINQLHQEPVDTVADPRLREFDFGKWEGEKYFDINIRCGNSEEEAEEDLVPLIPPDGESVEDFRERLLETLSEIARQHSEAENVMIVTHSLVIALARAHCAGRSVNALWEYLPENTEITTLPAEPETFR